MSQKPRLRLWKSPGDRGCGSGRPTESPVAVGFGGAFAARGSEDHESVLDGQTYTDSHTQRINTEEVHSLSGTYTLEDCTYTWNAWYLNAYHGTISCTATYSQDDGGIPQMYSSRSGNGGFFTLGL